MIKLVVCGDLCPTAQNMAAFESGNAKRIFTDTLPIIMDADIAIVNLECPLTDCTDKMFKSGPNIKASKRAVNGISDAKFDVISLANNHIKDFGVDGVTDTIDSCKKKRLKVVGAGKDAFDASIPLIIEKNGVKLGVISFADNEGSLAATNSAGANGFDETVCYDDISASKAKCDKLIVLYHSGIEHYSYPSPRLKKICRNMTLAGADIVTCQHSHCIGSMEKYNSSVIIYGQGNFLFSKKGKRENDKWNFGLILSLQLDKTNLKCDFIPTVIKGGHVTLAKNDLRQDILSGFLKRTEESQDEQFLKEQFDKQTEKACYNYFNILLGLPRCLSIANKILKNLLVKLFISKKKAIVMLNVIRCESHREMLMNAISKYVNDGKEQL